MKPRWVRSAPEAVTDRIHAVSCPSAPPASARRPRTLRLPAVPAQATPGAARHRGLTDPRHALAAGVLESLLDARMSLAVAVIKLGRRPATTHAVMVAIRDAQEALVEAHQRAVLHAATSCTRCVPNGYTCAWHHARLRSWWNARDREAVRLVARLDALHAAALIERAPR